MDNDFGTAAAGGDFKVVIVVGDGVKISSGGIGNFDSASGVVDEEFGRGGAVAADGKVGDKIAGGINEGVGRGPEVAASAGSELSPVSAIPVVGDFLAGIGTVNERALADGGRVGGKVAKLELAF